MLIISIMSSSLLHAKKSNGDFDKLQAIAKQTVLDEISDGHAANYAAKKAGVHRTTIYEWRKEDPDFDIAYAAAWEARADWYEERLRDTAADNNPTSIIVGLKMHKRFVEDRGIQGITINGDVNILVQQAIAVVSKLREGIPQEYWPVIEAAFEELTALPEGKG